jgi:drug/metabolite transporter (DMT)-like permease
MHYPLVTLLVSLVPTLSWGIMWLFVKQATKKLEVFQSQFLIQILGIPLLLLLLPFVPSVPSSFNLTLLLGLGIFETFVLTLYFYALKIGDLSIIGPLKGIKILFTVLLAALFLHESIYPLKIMGMVGVLVGVTFLGINFERKFTRTSLSKGVVPALISAAGTGVYFFFTSISSRLNGWYYTSLGIRLVIPLTIMCLFLIQKRNIRQVFQNVPWQLISWAAFFDVLAFSTFNYALNLYDVSYVTVVVSASPAISSLLAVMYLKEKLKIYQIIGIIIVVFGVIALSSK